MSTWIIWLIVAAILLLIEVLSQTVWTFCCAVGCLAAALLSVFVDSTAAALICIAVVAVLAWFALAPLVRRLEKKTAHSARTGMDALLGRRAIVIDEIRPDHLGRARIDGDYWQVKAPGIDHVIHHGREVVVTSYDSIILTVEEIS